jgi:hypothetical protein
VAAPVHEPAMPVAGRHQVRAVATPNPRALRESPVAVGAPEPPAFAAPPGALAEASGLVALPGEPGTRPPRPGAPGGGLAQATLQTGLRGWASDDPSSSATPQDAPSAGAVDSASDAQEAGGAPAPADPAHTAVPGLVAMRRERAGRGYNDTDRTDRPDERRPVARLLEFGDAPSAAGAPSGACAAPVDSVGLPESAAGIDSPSSEVRRLADLWSRAALHCAWATLPRARLSQPAPAHCCSGVGADTQLVCM